ncbi:MAG: DUF362 domain-containing protein [Candidatus Eiseniibacteriota bacterium]|jgi:uncharacterized Fe-S center protein
MSQVHLVAATGHDSGPVLARKIEALWEAADLNRCFQPRDLAALKLHVGEPGKTTFVSPEIVAALVTLLQRAETRPFLTDTAVLYRSPRDNAVGHARVAHDHGFTLERVGAPFVPADGLNGADEVEIPVGGRHYEHVAIATGILQARSMLVLSHATGHLGTGYGGALKNLGMGCSSKRGKLRQHHGQHPRIDPDTCIACAICAEWCPEDAITVEETAEIDESRCIGCGECVAVCLQGGVQFDWSVMGRELQERIAEHAAALVRRKAGRIAYVTVAMNITKDCDCLSKPQGPVCEDIGILASHDPVAIDQAVLELVRERTGRSIEELSYPDRDGSIQVSYAAELGIGEQTVELVPVPVAVTS